MRPLVLAVFFFSLSVQTLAADVEVYTRKDEKSIRLYITNPYACEVSLVFEVTSTNLTGAPAGVLVAPPGADHLLFELTIVDPQKRHAFSYTYRYKVGDTGAVHDKRAEYNLPFKEGTVIAGGQGFGGNFSHFGAQQFAVDFRVNEGTPVYPARPGTVVKIESGFSEGGKDPSFKDKANYIMVVHDDKTLGRYLHFRKDGIEVQPGQAVTRTTLLGYSGNTGYSSQPHLHFEVCVPNKALNYESLEFYFSNKKGENYTTLPGKNYQVDR